MVMKRYPHSAIILLAALTLAGCSKAEEFQTNSDSALQIESVSGISPFDLMQNQASKAVITGDSLPDDEAAKGIGLFVTATNGGAYDGHDSGYTNVKYAYSSTKWSAALYTFRTRQAISTAISRTIPMLQTSGPFLWSPPLTTRTICMLNPRP